MNISLVAAFDATKVIGYKGNIPWHLKEDLKIFSDLTKGSAVIMGRKTFESFPKPLPNRTHIVITRNSEYDAGEGIIVVDSIDAALDAVMNDDNPYVIGGGEIYKLALDQATHIELTRVHSSFEADAFFPEINENDWELVAETFHPKDERHDYAFTYLTYARR